MDKAFDEIIGSDHGEDSPNHKVTRYRRRDLRNELGPRLGFGSSDPALKSEDRAYEQREESPLPKRIRISKIPLDVSDYTLDDMMKEFGVPVFSKIFDNKEDRTCIYEFGDGEVMENIVERYNGHELNGAKIEVEIYQPQRKHSRINPHSRHKQSTQDRGRGRPGSHYRQKSSRVSKKSKARENNTPTSVEALDAELDAYMKG
ncbi:Yra2p [Saccharomyces cerevisiae x Saccharomyces kudriavzevii VIN7]|uniref:RNA annealing protein YRA2 n=1 Tax=Saccharomyces cerevisiae x Saccharomyces kudriavzevii (strain VIN7) TaxID=1095631 RepID=H0GX90_SACCK|nr:Yra2p [Saccharomyces cerevisiae x Saccharomyces kudriavzevii VIN7]